MNAYRFFTPLMLVLATRLLAQSPPELPNTSSLDTCLPDTAAYVRITVGPVGRDFSDLQQAINAAPAGSVLVLDAGVSFAGSFSLPNKTGEGWVVLISSAMNYLPEEGMRIAPGAPTGSGIYPSQQAAMPKIITTNPAGLPAFRTMASAHHYRLVGLEITASSNVVNSYGLVFLGDATSAQNTLNLAPHNIIVDRCYIHGHTQATIMKGGVLLNCANAAVVDSYLSDFHSVGYDTYAIGCTNGPGPFKILNNYLEAAGENVLFGGAAPAIPGLVPSDIEIRNNYFYKPYSWWLLHPSYAGKHWTVKNLFELKTGKRVLLDGNILENCWADLPTGQSGYAILLTVRSENGASPQAEVSDITITNNIIRHVAAGITLSGHDSPSPSLQSKRIYIGNNLFEDVNGPDYGDGNIYGPNDGTFIKLGDPADIRIEHNTVFQSGPITWVYDTIYSISITNNIFNCFLSDGGYQGVYGPGFAQGGNGPMGAFFPGISDANQGFHHNVLIGGNPQRYSNYNTLSQNYFPSNNAGVQFFDFANGASDYHNFRLAATSPFAHASAEGNDLGLNMLPLDTALQSVRFCGTILVDNVLQMAPQFLIQPNPVHGKANLMSKVPLENAELDVFDAMGRVWVHQYPLNGVQIGLEIENLPPGIYFASIRQAGLVFRPIVFSLLGDTE